MYKAFIDPQKCVRCVQCQASKACTLKAIFRIDNDDPNFVDATFCRGCGDCISKCVARAILLKED